MGIKKTIGTITLATGILFSGMQDGLVNLNKDEKDNRVRQGVVSEWGIAKARAEEVETLEEILESQIVGSEEETIVEENVGFTKKVNKPASERYPEIGFTDEVNQYFIDTMTEVLNARKHYVYEREMLTEEDVPVKVRVISRKDNLILLKADDDLTFLGEYVFNPDDPIFYYSDVNRKKGYILSFNDLSRKVDPQNNPFDNSSVAAPYYDTLIYGGSSFNQEEKYSVFSQIESGDLTFELSFVGEPEIVNEYSLEQGPAK